MPCQNFATWSHITGPYVWRQMKSREPMPCSLMRKGIISLTRIIVCPFSLFSSAFFFLLFLLFSSSYQISIFTFHSVELSSFETTCLSSIHNQFHAVLTRNGCGAHDGIYWQFCSANGRECCEGSGLSWNSKRREVHKLDFATPPPIPRLFFFFLIKPWSCYRVQSCCRHGREQVQEGHFITGQRKNRPRSVQKSSCHSISASTATAASGNRDPNPKACNSRTP